ncbi:MAG: hypothetical protein PHP75_08085, partial [Methylacidiphilaceae bacterium]|nr:hypothetical protein [Candidatus Methylacidiphilaceae bacterium]
IFPGPFLPVGLSRNCFGDTNALIRREVFAALGGFSEEACVEDWDLFIRACLAGFHLEAIPLPLYFYRVHSDSRFRSLSLDAIRQTVRRPYRQALPPALHGLLSLAQGQALRIETLEAEARRLSDALRAALSLPATPKRPDTLREFERTVRNMRKALLRKVADGAKPVSPRP